MNPPVQRPTVGYRERAMLPTAAPLQLPLPHARAYAQSLGEAPKSAC